jgi:penicillin-binding protein 1C
LKAAIVGLAVALVFSLAISAYALPTFQEVKGSYKKSDAVLLDRHGRVIHELRVDPRGRRLDWTTFKEISPALKKAVLQSEDRRFYEHSGIDWRGVGSAMMRTLFMRSPRGASTITMQLASILDKRLRPRSSKKTLLQKWHQMREAMELEKSWSKDEIFEAYLNLITFRGELQGISSASRGLFGKEPSGLNWPESLILASLIRSPNAPVGEVVKRACALERSLYARNGCDDIVLLAGKTLNGAYFIRPRISLAPHVFRVVMKKGRTSAVSTLDGDLQRFAIEVLKHHLIAVRSQNVRDGAVLVVENKSGDVLAYVGSLGDEASAGYVDGVRARRQAGSTLKPFLYATAFERLILTPASIVNDSPLDIPTLTGIYKPDDYENDFKGLVSARTALASSLNIPAVRTLTLTGIEPFIQKLRSLGFSQLMDDDYYGPSLALGSADVSLWELVNAYRTLANKGVRSALRIAFEKDGRGHEHHRVFPEKVAFLISDILSDREARSATFSLENPLSTRFWTAVKTGTSKDMRDNWCIGYSQRFTVGVWVGNFGGEPMWNVSGITGAAPVWLEIMNRLHANRSSVHPLPPDGVLSKKVTFDEGVEPTRSEWFIYGTEPVRLMPDKAPVVLISRYETPHIAYPPDGVIIALDPDIPKDNNMVFFEAEKGGEEFAWKLNGKVIGTSRSPVSWRPEAGRYRLSLVDRNDRTIDSVSFEVRGAVRDE